MYTCERLAERRGSVPERPRMTCLQIFYATLHDDAHILN